MVHDNPLSSGYTISRLNPLFIEEPLSAKLVPGPPRPPLSSGYESHGSSRVSSSLSEADKYGGELEGKGRPSSLGAADSVRQLSEGVSRSPTLLAVCRALDAGAGMRAGVDAVADARGSFLVYSSTWSEYLGSGIVPGDITLKAKGYEQVLDLTLDAGGAARLLALVEAGKRERCCCRIAIALLAGAMFLATLVAVSLAASRGARVFGSL